MEDDEIIQLCEQYGIKNYSINLDGSIDVNGDVIMRGIGITEIPIKFNKVKGDFVISQNKIKFLDNSPVWVGGHFHAHFVCLESLYHGPKYVGGEFSLMQTYLTNLKYVPDCQKFSMRTNYAHIEPYEYRYLFMHKIKEVDIRPQSLLTEFIAENITNPDRFDVLRKLKNGNY